MEASSATTGFFQILPHIPPQYTSPAADPHSTADDAILERLIGLYLPSPVPSKVDRHLHDLAAVSLSPRLLRLTVDAETNLPTLNPCHTFGNLNQNDALWTGEGWRGLKAEAARLGSVALGHSVIDGSSDILWSRRIHQFLANHLWSASAALVTCPAAMTDGAAVLLGRHLHDADGDQPGRAQILQKARDRLISFDPDYAWTSGQWMTERSGGSDVSGTETVAKRLDTQQLVADTPSEEAVVDDTGMKLGPWQIDGFKWFSSATDANMVVLLARTAKGISAFYAPMRRQVGLSTQMNGVRINRLKSKLGTKALPTSELEIKGMRAWLIGNEGEGIREISAMLNTTRLWSAAGSVAGWARGLAIARAFTRARKVKNMLLVNNPQHVRWLADETVKYRAAASLAFLGAALNGVVDQAAEAISDTAAQRYLPSDRSEANTLLRALTPVMKAQCSLASVDGLRACMECLGGVGYCENNEDGGLLNVARLFRDCNVNPIWEGTVSVMAEDLVRVLKGKSQQRTLDDLNRLLTRMLSMAPSELILERDSIRDRWRKLMQTITSASRDDLLYGGRQLLRDMESIFAACALLADAGRDEDKIAVAVARRWVALRHVTEHSEHFLRTRSQQDLDRQIFLGDRSSVAVPRAHI